MSLSYSQETETTKPFWCVHLCSLALRRCHQHPRWCHLSWLLATYACCTTSSDLPPVKPRTSQFCSQIVVKYILSFYQYRALHSKVLKTACSVDVGTAYVSVIVAPPIL
ncbi:hypothetical protein NQ314_018557 [Rhamnusium bicolor]|uniref:Uncharacterized protein n=1 Tax=Rhamnusium bicolor TaxID=1586634 RepID=A0AAV8WPW7_9CUCU|nr:hypothetical protein NQ314_018557 [Rhamnusium bicolor]